MAIFKINSTGQEIIADLEFVDQHHAGDYTLVPDAPEVAAPRVWPAFDFYRKFTMAEYIAIKELAKTDPVADYFLGTLDRAIASGSNVRSDDPDTIGGLAYLEGAGKIDAGRAAEILA